MLIVITIFLVYSCTNDGISKPKEYGVVIKHIDLTSYSDQKPVKPLNLLFIHHSTGGQLLADRGPEVGINCIYKTHPNGGGLRTLLEKNNYIVHEASYNSIIGDKTDICHWNAKFKEQMDRILTCSNQDDNYTNNTKNKIIIFKSCFPNNWIEFDGRCLGDPDSCEKTLENAQAAYKSILQYFREQPDTLFVVMTAPPLAFPTLYKKDKVINLARKITGRPNTIEKIGRRARLFNNWLKDAENGWIKNYDQKNVVVYDYYDVLTNYGQSDWSRYPSGNGSDSHPNSEGNTHAASEFISFLNRSVHRLGL